MADGFSTGIANTGGYVGMCICVLMIGLARQLSPSGWHGLQIALVVQSGALLLVLVAALVLDRRSR